MEKMLTDGATFIDIGGYSANQCRICFEEEELDRIVPAVESILKHFPETILSIDI
jgi:dihydropteroate synthase